MDDKRSTDETARDISAALKDLTGALSKQARQFTEAMQVFREKTAADGARIREAFETIQAKWIPIFTEFRKHQEAKDALRVSAGLLPHATTPLEVFNPEKPGDFGPATMEYYRMSWDAVEGQFLADLDGYHISDEAKGAMREALICHRHSLFRSVVLTLLPYVEMEFRRAFEIDVGGNAASRKELREIVWKVPAGIVFSHIAPMDLLQILDNHLYEQVKTVEALERFQKDAIPNRHAAIHGLIQYSSFQNSLNTLIVADYVFFLISQLRKHSSE